MQFRPLVLSVLVVLYSFSVSPSAWGQSSEWKGSCQVSFSGKSTLHDFDGTVEAEPFTVLISNFDTPTKARASSTVLVKAAKMDTGNKKRDVEMRKSLDVDNYPEIRVSVKDLAPEATNPRLDGEVPQPTVIPFVLSLKGKTHRMTARVTGWAYAKDNISCTVTFPVSLAAAGIKPPSVLGLVKVKDEVLVTAKLSLRR
jgi:polyisoprenoid-binding protein YceI